MEINKDEFDIEFIERTQQLIKHYDGNIEFTLLINCLLGLIILPNEFKRKRNLAYLNKLLSEIDEINEIINKSEDFIFNPTHWNNYKKKYINSPKTLECFLRKIRNGLAHIETIVPINKDGKWIGVRIKDVNNANNNVELEMTLRYDEILVISKYISNSYQKEVLEI